jgi:hypothetical protein
MREAGAEGWYYKEENRTIGPVSERDLNGLLAAARLSPRQAVWKQMEQGLLFVTAATAAARLAPALAQR